MGVVRSKRQELRNWGLGAVAVAAGLIASCAIGVTSERGLDDSASVEEPDEPEEDAAEPAVDATSAVDAAEPARDGGGDSGVPSPAKDAGSLSDASSVRDAGAMDAASDAATSGPDAALVEAGVDAGSSAGAKDAGSDAGRDSGVATADSGTPGGSCRASACTNDCSLAGPLQCCKDNGSCGCTWAPGAYCN